MDDSSHVGLRDFRDRDKLAVHMASRLRRRRSERYLPHHFIKVALVFDETFLLPFGEQNHETIEEFAVSIIQSVDQTFNQLQTRVLLVTIEPWMSEKDINVSSAADFQEIFQEYSRGLPNTPDVAFLLLFNSSDTIKTLTRFDSVCHHDSPSPGIIQLSDDINSIEIATLLSRGIATSIGLLRDTASCHCGNNTCVMNDSKFSASPRFSDCSHQTFRATYYRGKLWCLDKPPRNIELIDSPLCGNGIVESREECDCGNNTECFACCRDCRLMEGAQCSDGRCCRHCRLLLAGTLCRERSDLCDIPEYCTGDSEHCPENLVLHDGAPCLETGRCYAGVCETMLNQCFYLWGIGGEQAESECKPNITEEHLLTTHTYEEEICGFLKCNVTDVDVTSLQALSLMESADWASSDKSCKVISIPLADGTNRGVVPDGTACGEGKICHQRSCVPVDNPPCPAGIANEICSGNGVCATSGACVCFCGWRGPACTERNSTREGVVCTPSSVFITNDISVNTEAPPTDSDDTFDEAEVRVLTSAIIGGSLAIIFVVAIVFGATSIGFKRARKQNQARRMQQVKLFSMFQPTKSQKKRLAKFGGGRAQYKPGELDGATLSTMPTGHPSDDHHHQHHHHHQQHHGHHHHQHHHIPKQHDHSSGAQHGGRTHGKNKKQQNKTKLLIDMDTHKPDRSGDRRIREETII